MQRFAFPVLACLTLGLAPFAPEPHIVGKLRWVFGGAVGMAPIDWFDLALHAAPWVWLAAAIAQQVAGAGTDERRPRRVLLALAVAAAVVCVLWAALSP